MTPIWRCTCLLMLIAAMNAHAQTARDKLEAHSAEFAQGVTEVTDGVHVAIGFGLANSILIEGDGAAIVVDTMESGAAAETVMAEFRKITSDPVKAIIYTHNHYDHINGAAVFAGDDNPEVYSHSLLPQLVDNRNNVVQGAIFQRSNRQFGIPLPDERRYNAGIGPKLVLGAGPSSGGYLAPTKTFDGESMSVTVAGIDLKLVHTPGETDDQIYVWLPEKRVLMPGDNFYRAFPNLYAIRGTPYRDVRQWVASLDKMIAEEPEYLVPSHSRPIAGAERVRELLTDYRVAIDYVYKQTIAGMNRGVSPDELAHSIVLPERFDDHPYLTQFYGTVPWSVRSIYAGHLGWFDGNATNLFPLSPEDNASKMADLAGGVDALRKKAEEALEKTEYQWAAELADCLLEIDANDGDAKALKARSLIALADQQVSANARNYYLTSAMQLGAF